MALLRLPPDSVARFDNAGEVAMGIQVGRDNVQQYMVLGGIVTLDWGIAAAQMLSQIPVRLWQNSTASPDEIVGDFQRWLQSLEESSELEPVSPDVGWYMLPFILAPSERIPPSPPRAVYGHVPLFGLTKTDDVFYRYESFPTSRRINQSTLQVAPGTFAAPQSELPFMPTGLSAVARCALPSVMPARWRWEIQPVPGTPMRFGASVPLYGQSGGGVEVEFPNGTANRGPIANPVVLPIL